MTRLGVSYTTKEQISLSLWIQALFLTPPGTHCTDDLPRPSFGHVMHQLGRRGLSDTSFWSSNKPWNNFVRCPRVRLSVVRARVNPQETSPAFKCVGDYFYSEQTEPLNILTTAVSTRVYPIHKSKILKKIEHWNVSWSLESFEARVLTV